MQGSSQGGQTRDERTEVHDHAKELLKFCDIDWCGQGITASPFLDLGGLQTHHTGIQRTSPLAP